MIKLEGEAVAFAQQIQEARFRALTETEFLRVRVKAKVAKIEAEAARGIESGWQQLAAFLQLTPEEAARYALTVDIDGNFWLTEPTTGRAN